MKQPPKPKLLTTIIVEALLILAVITTVVSATNPYYKDWVYPGDTFSVNEDLYTLSASSNTEKVLLNKGGENYVIPYGECVLTRDGLNELCYEESDYMDCIHHDYACPEKDGEPEDWCCPYDVTHIKFDAGEAKWGAYLTFTKHKPVISVSHTTERTVLKLGESTDVKITFENSGEDTVTNAEYREKIPEGFRITPSSYFEREGNTLALHFSLAPGATKSYTYSLRPTAYLNEPITGVLSYTYKTVSETTKPSSLLISVPSPFIITHSFDPETPILGEKSTYTYTLKNNDGNDDMDAKISFSGKILSTVTKMPADIKKVNGLYVWSGTLKKGEEKSFEFSLFPDKTGIYILNVNASMEVNNEHFESPLQDKIIITTTKLEPEIRFSSEKPKAGSEITIRVFLKNGKTPYKSVQGVLNPGTHIFSLDRVAPDENALLGEINLTPSKRETFTLSGSYESLYGERFNFSANKNLDVDTSNLSYIITEDVNETTAVAGSSVEVKVKVKNQQGRYADVTVTDVLPVGALVTAGSREQTMSLKDEEERDAYTYHFTIPNSWESKNFPIVTRVYDHQSKKTYENKINLTITGIPEKTIVKNVTQKESRTNTTEPPKKEKKGFFKSIIDTIVDLMERIFS